MKKVFATQQKLVEKMFNMLSKYNAGIWVKKKHINCEMLLFQVSENRFLFMSDTSDSKPEVFLFFCSDIHYLLLHQQTIVACACNNEAFSCGVCMFLHCLRISLGTPG